MPTPSETRAEPPTEPGVYLAKYRSAEIEAEADFDLLAFVQGKVPFLVVSVVELNPRYGPFATPRSPVKLQTRVDGHALVFGPLVRELPTVSDPPRQP